MVLCGIYCIYDSTVYIIIMCLSGGFMYLYLASSVNF